MNMQSNEGALRRMACLLLSACKTEETNTGLESERGKIYLTPDHFLIFLMALFLSFFLSSDFDIA
jgi:hypothetical protein